MLDQITPVILTLDEEPNIARTLTALHWAGRIVVVDSGSTDSTCAIAHQFPNVEVISRPFDSHASQWNFAIGHAKTEWVLALDADYIVTADLVAELQQLTPSPEVAAYRASFTYVNLGRPLRGSLYPPKAVLFRTGSAHYEQDGHTQRVHIHGSVRDLRNPLLHDDRKPFGRWLESQLRYATLEAAKLRASDSRHLTTADRLRKAIVAAPFVVPLFVLLIRGTIFDGWPGIHYALQRGIAEALLTLLLIESHFPEPRTR